MNILLIVCDALRGDLAKSAGTKLNVYPAIDRLGEEGVSFRHAYCTMPLCVPSRISMLTGRWPDSHRVRMNLDANDAVFDKDIYEVTRERGYRTGLVGKNHTYLRPEDADFWREYGHEGGYQRPDAPSEVVEFDTWLKTLAMNVSHTPTPFPLHAQLSFRIASDAIDFINTTGDQPFFLQMSFPEPHGPIQLPMPYWDMFPPSEMRHPVPGPGALTKLGYRMQWLARLQDDGSPGSQEEWRRYLSNYCGAIRMVDDQIARVLAHLRETGRREETLVIFTADHGDFMMQYGVGRKGVGLSDALTRIPMIWSGSAVRRSPGVEDLPVSMADVMPTLCEAIGANIPNGVQGLSLWRALQDSSGSPRPRKAQFESVYVSAGIGGLYYDASDNIPVEIAEAPKDHHLWDTLNKVTQSGNQKMVRLGNWKLLYDMMGYGQLYNLTADPYEETNLFGRPHVAPVQAHMMRELTAWIMRVEDQQPIHRKYS